MSSERFPSHHIPAPSNLVLHHAMSADYRLTLILLIAEACHCCWVLEQPEGSMDVLPFHPRLDWLWNEIVYATRPETCNMLSKYLADKIDSKRHTQKAFNTNTTSVYFRRYHACLGWITSLSKSTSHLFPQAFRTNFWMILYGAESPKRTVVWSNYGDVIEKLA